MARDVKIITVCNNCNKVTKTTSHSITACKCGSMDMEILDAFDITLNKHKEERYAVSKTLVSTNIR